MMDSELSLTMPGALPQFVPSSVCFHCDVCCRFPDVESFLRPYFTNREIAAATAHGVAASSFPDASGSQITLALNPAGEGYLCPAFDPATSRCGIYEVRPLDCQLYPLALMWNADHTEVLLGWDTKCPFMREAVPEAIMAHAERVAILLATGAMIDTIVAHPRVIGRFQDDVVVLKVLPYLTARLLSKRADPRLCTLTPSDAPRFARALEQAGVLRQDAPAAYAFPYHYVWTVLLSYWWMEVDGTLFVFACSPDGWFMPLPPLGPRPIDQSVAQAFTWMQRWNGSSPVSRIENVIGALIPALQQAGMRCRQKEGDYLYKADALAGLSGDHYKSQRALCNRVEREHTVVTEPYSDRHQAGCQALYERWVAQKQGGNLDPMGTMLLQDAKASHGLVLSDYGEIGLSGTVALAQDRVVAYTFGYWLTPQTWCVLLEVADRSIAGLAQWLFRETCRAALSRGAIYINAMDDAGLPGLRNAKLAYRPLAVIDTWVVTGC
ncbi:MAG TPA: phosphatidylglycerol lysyltransferase domain-containing protein [Nitrospira sp.]|nr:phosphatidylglycerol lysyltransferase domain-containing protein [Nitrospira sp.]